MSDFRQFRHGTFEGLWIDGKTVHIFLASEGAERFAIVADGVIALAVEGVKAGNIISEVVTRGPGHVLYQDMQTLYAPEIGPSGEAQVANLVDKARLQGWKVLEIVPTYGASALVLTASLQVLPREVWFGRYVIRVSH